MYLAHFTLGNTSHHLFFSLCGFGLFAFGSPSLPPSLSLPLLVSPLRDDEVLPVRSHRVVVQPPKLEEEVKVQKKSKKTRTKEKEKKKKKVKSQHILANCMYFLSMCHEIYGLYRVKFEHFNPAQFNICIKDRWVSSRKPSCCSCTLLTDVLYMYLPISEWTAVLYVYLLSGPLYFLPLLMASCLPRLLPVMV